MLINLRNALMAGKRLPYDAEVEYLQCVGFDTYVDTGVYPNATTDCEVGVSFAGSNTNYPTPIGMVDGTTRYLIRYGSPDSFFQLSAGNGVAFIGRAGNGPSSPNIGYPKVFKISGGKSYVDGVQTSTLYNSVVNLDDFRYTLWVGNQNYRGGFNTNCSATNMQITFCKIWKNGVLVRDYIPVRKGTVGYMYDRVSGKLFGNAGTGDFVLGPEIHEVEWLDFKGSQYLDFGFKPTQSTTVSMDIIPADTGAKNIGWLSAGNVAGVKYECYGWSNIAQIHYGNESGTTWVAHVSDHIKIQLGKVSKFENLTLGTENTKTFTDTSFTAAYNLTVGALNRGGYSYYAKMRLNSMSVSGDRTINCVPVRVGTDATSWEGAMMDVLTRRIYRNQGRGAFTYGNDLKYPIPAE